MGEFLDSALVSMCPCSYGDKIRTHKPEGVRVMLKTVGYLRSPSWS